MGKSKFQAAVDAFVNLFVGKEDSEEYVHDVFGFGFGEFTANTGRVAARAGDDIFVMNR